MEQQTKFITIMDAVRRTRTVYYAEINKRIAEINEAIDDAISKGEFYCEYNITNKERIEYTLALLEKESSTDAKYTISKYHKVKGELIVIISWDVDNIGYHGSSALIHKYCKTLKQNSL